MLIPLTPLAPLGFPREAELNRAAPLNKIVEHPLPVRRERSADSSREWSNSETILA